MSQTPAPAVGSPLLTTKLFLPRLRPGMVARPQLVGMLHAALSFPLTLVSAPAGFGKTTLVAAWAQQQPLPVGWLSLDAGDNDPNRFLAYLIAALQTAEPNLGRELRAALAPDPVLVDRDAVVRGRRGQARRRERDTAERRTGR